MERRALLADCIFDVVQEYEAKYEQPSAKVQAACDKMFAAANQILDEIGVNEIPKVKEETEENGGEMK